MQWTQEVTKLKVARVHVLADLEYKAASIGPAGNPNYLAALRALALV